MSNDTAAGQSALDLENFTWRVGPRDLVASGEQHPDYSVTLIQTVTDATGAKRRLLIGPLDPEQAKGYGVDLPTALHMINKDTLAAHTALKAAHERKHAELATATQERDAAREHHQTLARRIAGREDAGPQLAAARAEIARLSALLARTRK
jgi:hypothetical protein